MAPAVVDSIDRRAVVRSFADPRVQWDVEDWAMRRDLDVTHLEATFQTDLPGPVPSVLQQLVLWVRSVVTL